MGSRRRRIASSLRRAPLISLTIIVTVGLSAILADSIAPYSPYEISLENSLQPPFWQGGGSLAHPLGTDSLGRDLLSRMIYGARVSLAAAFLTIVLGGAIGTVVGLLSGYLGGRLDMILMRVTDATLAFPIILMALLLAVALGPSFINVVIAIVVVLWSRYARVIRGEVLSLKGLDFIAQARITGCSPLRIMVRHLLPNVQNTLVVLLTLQVGWVIVVEATLSFLGAGIPPPTPAWGSMVADGRAYILSAWWTCTLPALAILITVLSFNLFGDWLRDTLDPRLRQV